MKARLAVIAAALALSGCISFGGGEVPDTLLSLSPEAPRPAGPGASGTLDSAIVVLEPEAGQRLDVQRVPVQVDAANVAYLKDAMWVERPARLLQRLVADTLRDRGNRLVLDSDPGANSAVRLSGRLVDMGYDAQTSSAVVRFDAVREMPGGRLDSRRFESVVGGVPAEARPVGAALNRAANDVARQVADWLG